MDSEHAVSTRLNQLASFLKFFDRTCAAGVRRTRTNVHPTRVSTAHAASTWRTATTTATAQTSSRARTARSRRTTANTTSARVRVHNKRAEVALCAFCTNIHTRICPAVVDSCTISLPSNSTPGGAVLVASGVCGAHGACVSHGDNSFSCRCDRGFAGAYCHISTSRLLAKFVFSDKSQTQAI